MTADLAARDLPATEQKMCGCSCGCHIVHHTGYDRKPHCRNLGAWLPEYKVWACRECLVTCDG